MASVWKLMCPKHQTEIHSEKMIPINKDGIVTKIPMFFCNVCNKYYIHTDAIVFNGEFDYDEYVVCNIEDEPFEKTEEDDSVKKIYSYSELCPAQIRKSKEEIEDYLDSFELLVENYETDFPFSLVHYAFLYRRFEFIHELIQILTKDEWAEALHFKGPEGYEWITPLVCAKWNLNYLYGYDEKNGMSLMESLQEFLDEADDIDEILEYTDAVDTEGRSVFDIVWGNIQPLLDVVYYEKQELASKQIRRNHLAIVMDEVGTGKTVSALYAIRDVLKENKKRNQVSKILVVCPYNKREDWQSDIRRQIGRYAHVVEQSDNGLMYAGALKKVFFKQSEEIIMISGQKKGTDTQGSHTALKESIESYSASADWDLVIIDECHISFKNYHGIRAERAMLLTATPIVINAKEKRTFGDYLMLLSEITGTITNNIEVDPILTRVPTEADVYVNWFRDDMGKKAAERKICFLSCKRHPDRNDLFYRMKDEAGALAALQYDQDDAYLFDAAFHRYGFSNVKEIRKNHKLEKLVEFLQGNLKSYIIFCEHQFVVELIFDKLVSELSDVIVAEKFGKFEKHHGLENIQEGQLINTLMQNLRANKRVLFITTGKTGGTGLNLGEFEGVIHYELPFTSIELEQRFGRIDRIDTCMDVKNREMVFLLNECKADENDLEINRMLYYCTTKIDITCQYMPIRNTVLYYPEFIKRNGAAIRDSLLYFANEFVLSEMNERVIKEIKKTRRKYETEIKTSVFWKYMDLSGKTVRECVLKTLRNEKREEIPDKFYAYLNEYIEYLKRTKAKRSEYERVYKQFLETKRNVYNWLGIIGLLEIDSRSDVFVGVDTLEDGEVEEVEHRKECDKEPENRKISSVQKQIRELLQFIDNSNFENIESKGFSAEGIFCYIDNSIRRLSVDEYREGKNWR